MIYQQTDLKGFHIGQVAELAPGAIDTDEPVYNKATQKAKWDGATWVIDTIENWNKAPLPPIADRRASAKQAIDQAAGNARQRYVSVGQMVEEEYRLALQQVKDWRAAGSPSSNVPPAIGDWAIAAGITNEEAAVSIEQTAFQWEQVLLDIRNIRLPGKVAVDNAADLDSHDDMMNVAQPYIDQLNAMKPVY